MKKPWIRLVIASSIDGRIAYPEGGKTQLGKEGDRLVLEESLAWADGVLIGGQTLRDHKSICLIHNENLIQQRLSKGKEKQPIALIVSNQASHPSIWPFFQQPVQRWLLQNTDIFNENLVPNGYHKKINLSDNWFNSLKILNNKGLSKIALLGGASLISSFIVEDLIDELQITITPQILGGRYCWIAYEFKELRKSFNKEDKWDLKESRKLGNSELLIRYFRNRNN